MECLNLCKSIRHECYFMLVDKDPPWRHSNGTLYGEYIDCIVRSLM